MKIGAKIRDCKRANFPNDDLFMRAIRLTTNGEDVILDTPQARAMFAEVEAAKAAKPDASEGDNSEPV
jgi:hypothetical protein